LSRAAAGRLARADARDARDRRRHPRRRPDHDRADVRVRGHGEAGMRRGVAGAGVRKGVGVAGGGAVRSRASRRGYFTRTAGPVTPPAYRTRYTPAPGTATA